MTRRPAPARVVLAGAYGYGAIYLRRLAGLAASGTAELAGICDPRPPSPDLDGVPAGTPWTDGLPELLDKVNADVVIVAAPIHRHLDLAEAALAAGADVLLEKPPTPTLAGFDALTHQLARTGRRCQVGFQSFGTDAIEHVQQLVADGVIGEVRGVGAAGAWVRTRAYWERSAWAGRRELDGHPVVDGVVTNPLAHALSTALRLDGSDRRGDLADVRTELFRANDIEADDTSCVRVTTTGGSIVVAALTLCARESREPYVVVVGSRGRAVLWYKTGRVDLTTPEATTTREFPFTDLLENLLAHRRDPSVPLISPLERSGAFTEVLEAVRTSSPPTRITEPHRVLVGDGPGRHPVVSGVDDAVDRAATTLRTFREQGLPWAVTVAS
ncbi:Gfo/Idh/MocA family oxidoreductase [Jiangella aurantiaca]|uniref:Gfo/Idh/MocA family oxidoreductase n=1 Tax=Jiangella aurantiaca TaxID=2530373 RepID=A0A4R5A8X1_9ACTN|nr:Gfo/Idh/MocA family oxidoreductase [Jiangella aurantiaca]TDD66132.1 Gfo/Idh/MocA family oxidoreductase [Jiangella aurantiaca]